MNTYIIDSVDVIEKITGKDIYKKIILHVNSSKREAKYESDYTLYELTEKSDYFKVQSLLNDIKNCYNRDKQRNKKEKISSIIIYNIK